MPPLIIAALKDEIRDFKSGMEIDCTIHFKPAILYRGEIFNKPVDLLVTGLGGLKMYEGIKQALALQRPDFLLNVGYAGGASPVVSLGSLVLAAKVVHEKNGEALETDPKLFEEAKKLCRENRWNFHTGGVVTVERVISSPHEKADIGATNSSIALEMEAFSVGRLGVEKKIPWLVVKAILDPVETTIPDWSDCLYETGEAKPGKLLERFFKSPREFFKLPHMQYCATQARGSLTRFLEGWVRALY